MRQNAEPFAQLAQREFARTVVIKPRLQTLDCERRNPDFAGIRLAVAGQRPPPLARLFGLLAEYAVREIQPRRQRQQILRRALLGPRPGSPPVDHEPTSRAI